MIPSDAQLVINEFMASNQSVYPDNSDFDDYSDWIELYNPAETNVSLAGHFLTDDLTQPFKWMIPDQAEVPANGFLMFRADGFNAGPGETHVRGFYPWGSTFQTRRYHTGFKLRAAGEAVGLYRTESPPQEITLVPEGAVWKYLDTGTDPGSDWMQVTYPDEGWPSGPAELGYGDGDEDTEVGYGPDSSSKYPTTHFRHHFQVTDPTRLGNVRFRVLIDDGAILYLNGEEITRIRMPEGLVTYQDYARETVDSEDQFELVELPVSFFRAGDNVLAVEVHQRRGTSTDISFNAELLAAEIQGVPILVDAVEFGPQVTDVSYGRDAASTNGWSYFGEPTPESSNTTTALDGFDPAPPVHASLDSGFYADPQSVTLTASPNDAGIRYTLDGSIPTADSAAYDTALTVTNTTILRARTFSPGTIPGPVLTRSYFLGDDIGPTLPVFSLVADPATLFDDTIGIYENDTAYPYKAREIPVRLEFFEADQSPAFAVGAGLRIAGENIWRKPQKPFNIYCRSKYGDDVIGYQVFPGEPVATFGELNLRNGGDDWEESLLRDAMMPSILEGQTETSLYTYRPSTLFLNGQFWGIYNIRKRFDPVHFAQEHQLAEGDYDLVKYAHEGSSSVVLTAEAGNTEAYETFRNYVTANNPADDAVYTEISEQMNIDSFIDYVVGTDFAVNTSWSHNREFWRGHAPGSRWQWIINDFDRGLNASNISGSLIDNFQASYTLFGRLDNNTNFVNRLLQRYAAHLGSTLHPDRISDQLDRLTADVDGEIERHIDRWGSEGGISSLASRQAELDEIKQFAIDRPPHATGRLERALGLNRGLTNLTVSVSPPAGGTIRLAGVPLLPEYTETVKVFRDTPLELTAEPSPGYAFGGWSTGSTNRTIETTLTGAESITATFLPGAETVLPATIASNARLTLAGSPYSVNQDLVVQAGATLTLDPGVRLVMPPRASILVYGALQANGSETEPVEIYARGDRPWGNLSFIHATGPSTLRHVRLRGATLSRQDPYNLRAAISGYHSTLTLESVDIEAPQPVFARFGSTTLRNCRVHIQFTGDGINVKSGTGRVEDSIFIGNQAPDTDAIDFDDVTGGVLSGNRIYAFRGFNSDAIDVGEGCQDLLVVSNQIFNITDKGVSVGQASTVRIERNLIVDCGMGVGVKDTGSSAIIDQNTFARNDIGVAVFEKNVGSGGGNANISNCIFSRSRDVPYEVDALSTLTIRYSLSDTLSLPGTGNQADDPRFTDPGSYDFSLTTESPAIDAGDPAHATDPDGSIADLGAYYRFDTEDYPYLVPNIAVINEVLAHSDDLAPDWIELFNTSSQDLDIGGWYLSDDPDVPEKYQIAAGTLLPAHGYRVFYEDLHFGVLSTNSGALRPFALSENGETVNLFGPSDGLRPDYTEKEKFGPSERGVTKGRFYKESTRTFNFVALAQPTPGSVNSAPLIGPVVISEIMYHPVSGSAEFLELVNISPGPVTLLDSETGEPWRLTKGIDHVFPSTDPVVLEPGQRILLVRDRTAFDLVYSAPPESVIFQWDAEGLSNGGETIELSKPGDVDNLGQRLYIRVDRVDYSDDAPWPTGPDGGGTSLARINERAYGNDVANWMEHAPTPAQSGFQKWASDLELPEGLNGPGDDPEGDGINNVTEYALGTHPLLASTIPWKVDQLPGRISISLPTYRPDLSYVIEQTDALAPPDWVTMGTWIVPGANVEVRAEDAEPAAGGFYRLVITLHNL